MQRKLTITVDEEVYEGLHNVIGPRKISRFIENLIRPHIIEKNLDTLYQQMAKNENRENKALEWAEATFRDVADEPR